MQRSMQLAQNPICWWPAAAAKSLVLVESVAENAVRPMLAGGTRTAAVGAVVSSVCVVHLHLALKYAPAALNAVLCSLHWHTVILLTLPWQVWLSAMC